MGNKQIEISQAGLTDHVRGANNESQHTGIVMEK
jgi:hypothetical protein